MGQSSSSSSIAIFTRPGVPLDVFSCPVDPPPLSGRGEAVLVNEEYRNKSCRPVPAAAIQELVAFWGNKNPELASDWRVDKKKGPVTGSVFFSKNKDGLETLHGALLRPSNGEVVEICLADIYGADTLGGARMEDCGGIAGGFNVGRRDIGHSLVYVSSKEKDRTRAAVYKTNLADGKMERLTPPGQYDLSPAVSPSGEMVAVANLRWNKSTGELENQMTDIVVMNVDRRAQGGLRRQILIKDGGWPTWGSDNVVFFHRAVTSTRWGFFRAAQPTWVVFRYDISTKQTIPVTPKVLDAMTPAAISETKVAVATIRKKSGQTDGLRVDAQYHRHIEIFDVNAGPNKPSQITKKIRPLTDHYNPFILDGGRCVGYCCEEPSETEPSQEMNSTVTPPRGRYHVQPLKLITQLAKGIVKAMVLMWSWLSPSTISRYVHGRYRVQPLELITQLAMKKHIREIGMAMMLMWSWSWLNSDLWQRATAKMKEIVEPSYWRVSNVHSWAPNWEALGRRAWPWTRSMPKPNLYSCARSCVALALVLLAAILLGRYMKSRDSLLEQPGWPEMEKAMAAAVCREVNITSSLSGASIEYLSKATNRYLYLAIVHASVLGSRFRPEDITLLRGKVQSLETEKIYLRAKQDALVKEIDDLPDDGKALEKAETRITDLQQQLDMLVHGRRPS